MSRSGCATGAEALSPSQLDRVAGRPGQIIVEDAGYYVDDDNLYLLAAKREDGEPATRTTPTPF